MGGGNNGSGGKITIKGGAITAQGNNSGAGVGGGYAGNGGTILINGGVVKANGGNGSNGGAGIGGGAVGGSGGIITINSGTINATGGGNFGGAGIGGGGGGTVGGGAGTISINGGTITATCASSGIGNRSGTGIGSGSHSTSGGTISITGGTIIAKSAIAGWYGSGNAGIGGPGTHIIIRGGTLTVIPVEGVAAVICNTFNVIGFFNYWTNLKEHKEPEEKTGSGDFNEENPFPLSSEYKFLKLEHINKPKESPTPPTASPPISVSPSPSPSPSPSVDPPTVSPSPPNDPLAYSERDVLAKVVGEGQFKLSVGIVWGDMKFVYDAGEKTWDPITHKYIDGTGTASWLVDDSSENGGTATEWYLERGNNKIEVTNHSNGAIMASFNYLMLTGTAFDKATAGDASPFNTNGDGPDVVVGGFYASEESAKTGALILSNPKMNAGFNTLPNGRIYLPTAEGRAPDSLEIVGSAYFAFSGKPDSGRIEVLPNFRKVGAITVTIAPDFLIN
jgi:hypothetical protein